MLRYSRAYRFLRRLGRSLGVNGVVARMVGGDRYEDRFDRAFCASLRPGDCVWDVGANVGHYTQRFAAAVGPTGSVVAFEPGPVNAAALAKATEALPNVRRMTIALGNDRSQVRFWQGDPALGFQSRCLEDGEASSLPSILVDVRRGDDIVRESPTVTPNAIKIDVEGFEPEVIEGLGSLLSSDALHTIGVEVHQTILEQRGRDTAPGDIAHLLTHHGFHVTWVDHSHLIGQRRT